MNKDIENISKYGNLGRIELRAMVDARGPRRRTTWAENEAAAKRRREQFRRDRAR